MKILLSLIAIALTSCGGGNNGMDIQVEVPVIDATVPPDCSAIVSWTSPTQYDDDSPMLPQDLDHFTLFIETGAGEYRQVMLQDIFLRQWQERNLKGGENFFTMTVTDNGNSESVKSNEITRLLDLRCTGE